VYVLISIAYVPQCHQYLCWTCWTCLIWCFLSLLNSRCYNLLALNNCLLSIISLLLFFVVILICQLLISLQQYPLPLLIILSLMTIFSSNSTITNLSTKLPNIVFNDQPDISNWWCSDYWYTSYRSQYCPVLMLLHPHNLTITGCSIANYKIAALSVLCETLFCVPSWNIFKLVILAIVYDLFCSVVNFSVPCVQWRETKSLKCQKWQLYLLLSHFPLLPLMQKYRPIAHHLTGLDT